MDFAKQNRYSIYNTVIDKVLEKETCTHRITTFEL